MLRLAAGRRSCQTLGPIFDTMHTEEALSDGPGPALSSIPPFAWRGSLSPLLLVPATLPPLALFVAPSDVLESSPLLRSFCQWVVTRVLDVHAPAASTEIPEVALLVHCLALAVVPLLALVVFLQTLYNYKYILARHLATGLHPMRKYFFPLVGIPLSLVLLVLMVVVLPGEEFDRTLFYAFLVFSIPLFCGYMLGSAFVFLRLFVDAYLFAPRTRRRR